MARDRRINCQTLWLLIRTTTGMANSLPPELWSYIFDLAADQDTIFYPGLPTSMTQSSWARSLITDWQLRTPQDTINMLQRRVYATKKVGASNKTIPLCNPFSVVNHINMQILAQSGSRVPRSLPLFQRSLQTPFSHFPLCFQSHPGMVDTPSTHYSLPSLRHWPSAR